jgi:hypothetical protein
VSAFVTLTCPARDDVLVMLAGEDITLGGGVGGTSTVDLPRDTAAVHWETHPPYTLSVQAILEGFASGRSVEGDARRLLQMARAEPGEARPPVVTVDGPVPRSDLDWLIEGIEWGETIRREDWENPDRLRQHVTVQLVQDSRAELAVYRRKKPKAKTYKWKRGDTPTKVAHRLKVRGGARALKRANPRIRDWKRVKPDTRIKLP